LVRRPVRRPGVGGLVRGAGGGLRLRRPGRVGPGLRDVDPQEPGERVPLRDHPGAYAALLDAAAEPALHGRHPGQEAGDPRRNQKGPGDGGAAAGRESSVHGLEAAAGGFGRGEKVDDNHTPRKIEGWGTPLEHRCRHFRIR